MKTHRRALLWLCITIFVLLSAPRMNLRIGPIPFYFIDLFLLITYVLATKLRPVRTTRTMFGNIVGVIFFLAIVSEIYGAVSNASYFEPIYNIARTLMAFSIFISARRIIRTQEDLNKVLVFAFFGITVTALLLVLSSIPPTRSFSNNYIFSITFFEPASESVINSYSKYVGAMRGRSYVGVSILSAAFVNSIWPLLLLLRKNTRPNPFWKSMMFAGFILLPASVVFTYSRGAIIGLVFVALGILIFNSGNARNLLVTTLFAGVMIFIYIGLDSGYFYFQRLEKSTTRIVEQPVQKRNETERLYAYVEPFWHLQEHPEYIVLGEGLTHSGVAATTAIIEGNRADHAAFAKSYYAYGLLAALLYVVLLFSSLVYTLNNAVLSRSVFTLRFSRVLFPVLLGLFPWFVLGHAAVSTHRGATLFLFIIALVTMQTSLKPLALLEQESKAIKEQY